MIEFASLLFNIDNGGYVFVFNAHAKLSGKYSILGTFFRELDGEMQNK